MAQSNKSPDPHHHHYHQHYYNGTTEKMLGGWIKYTKGVNCKYHLIRLELSFLIVTNPPDPKPATNFKTEILGKGYAIRLDQPTSAAEAFSIVKSLNRVHARGKAAELAAIGVAVAMVAAAATPI
jgi:hypothetical protein